METLGLGMAAKNHLNWEHPIVEPSTHYCDTVTWVLRSSRQLFSSGKRHEWARIFRIIGLVSKNNERF
jgi:hypothetical protein